MAKKKLAFLIAYNGTSYSGLQYNGEHNTIEKIFIEALLFEKLIKKENAEPKKIGLQQCCRTDKGVSAALNILVCKVENDPNINNLNIYLEKYKIFIYETVRVSKTFFAKSQVCSRIYKYFLPLDFLKNKDGICKNLKNYVGSKNYTNFTQKSNDRGKTRHIKNIEIKPVDDLLEITIHGQSFMIHQIRKMVGLVLLIDNFNFNSESVFEKVFGEGDYINIPKVPGQFLMLRRPVFDGYNERKKLTHDSIYISDDRLDEIENKYISKTIREEENRKSFNYWLDTVKEHFYEFEHFNKTN